MAALLRYPERSAATHQPHRHLVSPGKPKYRTLQARPDEAAQREIAECVAKLKQHPAALEAGADPVLVTSWMSEIQARRTVAEARIGNPSGRRRLTRDEITSLVTALGDVMRVLRDADPADKAEVYSRLGLTLTYHQEENE